jgi:hypothetical protein
VTTAPQDDYRDLDPIFETPEWLPAKQKVVYEILVARMRRESAGLPMNTLMQVLIERIALGYATLRLREGKPLGDREGFADASQAKDVNAFFLRAMKEFNDQLYRATSQQPGEQFMQRLKAVLVDALSKISDTGTRNEVRGILVDALAEYGL